MQHNNNNILELYGAVLEKNKRGEQQYHAELTYKTVVGKTWERSNKPIYEEVLVKSKREWRKTREGDRNNNNMPKLTVVEDEKQER